jgi:hypothetical protein
MSAITRPFQPEGSKGQHCRKAFEKICGKVLLTLCNAKEITQTFCNTKEIEKRIHEVLPCLQKLAAVMYLQSSNL